jgi:hypothetical protein
LRRLIASLFLASACALSFARTFASFGLLRHSPSSDTNRSIGEALADDTGQHLIGAGQIVDAKSDTIVMPEIKFRKVTVLVLFFALLMRIIFLPSSRIINPSPRSSRGVF